MAETERGPLSEFAAAVEEYRVAGDGRATAVGWALYAAVILDAFINLHGRGALSLFLSGLFLDADGPRITGRSISIITFTMQIVGLVAAGWCLSNSPWRLWLRATFYETWPGIWLRDIYRLRRQPQEILKYVKSNPLLVGRDLGVFLVGLIMLVPLFGHLSAFALSNPLLGFILLILVAYALTKIALAIASNIHRDAPTAWGLAIGAAVVVWAGIYSEPEVFARRLTDAGLAEFLGYQTATICAALGALLLGAMRSIGDRDIVTFDLSRGQTAMIFDLPDAVKGAYRPFQFKVNAHDKKVVLLSRDSEDSDYYTIHTSHTVHDLTEAHWTLLNLTELENSLTSANQNGRISHTQQGQTRYFECRMEFRLTTVTPESHFEHLKDGMARIAVRELANLRDRILSKRQDSTSFLSAFYRDIDAAIGRKLDDVHIPGSSDRELDSISILGLNARLGSLDAEAKRLTQRMDREFITLNMAAAPRAIELDRANAIEQRVRETLLTVETEIDQFLQKYKDLTKLDSSAAIIHSSVDPEIRKAIKDVLENIAGRPDKKPEDTRPALRLLDLVTLVLEHLEIRMTSEAESFQQKVNEICENVEAHWTKKCEEFREATKERNEATRKITEILLDRQTPYDVRRRLLDNAIQQAGLTSDMPDSQREITDQTQSMQSEESHDLSGESDQSSPDKNGAFPD